MEKLAEVLNGLREERRELIAKVAGLDRAIVAIENAMAVSPAATPGYVQNDARMVAQSAPPPAVPQAPPGPYATPGFYDAAALYLATTPGVPRSAREIADALVAGGFRTEAVNFQASVRTMLHRKPSAIVYGIHASEEGNRWFVAAPQPESSGSITSGAASAVMGVAGAETELANAPADSVDRTVDSVDGSDGVFEVHEGASGE